MSRRWSAGLSSCRVEEIVSHNAAFSFLLNGPHVLAAGDAFAGGLATGIVEGMDLADAVHLANAAGALSVTREGAQDSMPSRDDVQSFLERL